MTSPDVIIDAKTHSGYGFDNDELPASYQLQAQWYMMLTNSHAADFHVLHFALGDFRTYRVERDDVLIGDLRMIANKFWQHVQNGTPPDYTVGDNIAQWLAALKKPRDEFWADDEMLELIQAYKTASEIKNEAQKSADEHREKILNRMRCMPDVIIDPMTETVVVRIQKRKDGTFHMMKVV
jgi:predicted phage-related endonuclease